MPAICKSSFSDYLLFSGLLLSSSDESVQRGWKLTVNVRIHVHFYAGFDDEFWSCNAGFCSPTPSVSSPPILPPLAEQKPSLHRQNTLFTKDHSYKSFQTLWGKNISRETYIYVYSTRIQNRFLSPIYLLNSNTGVRI